TAHDTQGSVFAAAKPSRKIPCSSEDGTAPFAARLFAPGTPRDETMRRLLAGGLALSAALWAASAWAGDGQAPASRAATPAGVKADSATDYASFVNMGRPEALDAPAANQSKRPPVNNRQLKPAMFVNPLLERGESVVRG